MPKLYKQFAESVIRWRINNKADEFLVARLRLTFFYSITAIVILGGASFIVYDTVLSDFIKSVFESGLGPDVSRMVIDNTRDILMNLLIAIDASIIILVVILGFLLTEKTLEPIKSNMQKQKRFIADASHEIRTPIAVVMSGIEVALSNKKLDLSLAKKTLENVLNEMKEFSKLSNYLLDLSKYDKAKQTEYQDIQIGELIKSILEKNINLAQLKNINFEKKIESQAIIQGNEMELGRAFLNILDNAIKYTPEGGTIRIFDKITSDKYFVTISDTGVGIKESFLSKIFDPFFRGDSSRSTEGAGLGLTLVRKIIENHKGSISIKSQVNKGTNVTISLPISSH